MKRIVVLVLTLLAASALCSVSDKTRDFELFGVRVEEREIAVKELSAPGWPTVVQATVGEKVVTYFPSGQLATFVDQGLSSRLRTSTGDSKPEAELEQIARGWVRKIHPRIEFRVRSAGLAVGASPDSRFRYQISYDSVREGVMVDDQRLVELDSRNGDLITFQCVEDIVVESRGAVLISADEASRIAIQELVRRIQAEEIEPMRNVLEAAKLSLERGEVQPKLEWGVASGVQDPKKPTRSTKNYRFDCWAGTISIEAESGRVARVHFGVPRSEMGTTEAPVQGGPDPWAFFRGSLILLIVGALGLGFWLVGRRSR